jgi:hypothetical protein
VEKVCDFLCWDGRVSEGGGRREEEADLALVPEIRSVWSSEYVFFFSKRTNSFQELQMDLQETEEAQAAFEAYYSVRKLEIEFEMKGL